MKSILIIEDQSDIRRLIRWSLETEGYTFREANNGEQGLAAARAEPPALILLDVMMPGALDGLQTCALLKADPELAGVPVVMLSARAQASDLEAGDRAGADAYLAKPFSPLELIETVNRLTGAPAGG
ncbi:MAG: response regulator [Burkholderiaceae bacterium]|nr:response regulator [Burkholderiaceae bacterium]